MLKFILLLFIFNQFFPLYITKDADCYAITNPQADTDCTTQQTGTFSICCFATYQFANKTTVNKCLTIDGTNEQNTIESIETAIDKLPSEAVSKDINCLTKSEECYDIKSPTSFASCNITEQKYPFTCCYIDSEIGKYCYPLNARYQNYIDNYATALKQTKNLTKTPKIICSTKPLPKLKSSYYISLTKLYFISVIMIVVFF